MKPKLLDVIALLEDIPEHSLIRGQVGTLVEELSRDVFEVEFSDNQGVAHTLIPLSSKHFLVLYYDKIKVA